ncbi:dihydrofolate reductase family protein [Falsiroseomonas sp. HW251]|uniref:dihydrofolate reductase family protein n=1 Tax=Falsiroseomonas sp. HW251 TaxID=3390998 RepID=UPI003D322BDB
MSRLRVHAFAVSLDGFGAGPDQDLQNPMGRGGMALHQWAFPTRFFHAMQGKEGGTTGPDDDAARRGFEGIGAWILGRNMFGPVRGGWGDLSWRGWWGEEPPYRCPVFVLTHHPRESLAKQGGTVFHFVTEGIHRALDLAREAAGGRDVRLGGGVSTLRQYLAAGLVDEMEFAIAPVLLGAGEAVFAGLDLPALGYRRAAWQPQGAAAHVRIERG